MNLPLSMSTHALSLPASTVRLILRRLHSQRHHTQCTCIMWGSPCTFLHYCRESLQHTPTCGRDDKCLPSSACQLKPH